MEYKDQGNRHFAAGCYAEAISAYTKAIVCHTIILFMLCGLMPMIIF